MSDTLMSETNLGVEPQPVVGVLLGSFIYAHLALVVFHSHANPVIFRSYPLRFTLVPIVLFLAMWSSPWRAVSVSALVTWWDVYHSGLQTFGLGRIYDSRASNPAELRRRLDWGLNLLLYVGPIPGGATLIAHVGDFMEFEEAGSWSEAQRGTHRDLEELRRRMNRVQPPPGPTARLLPSRALRVKAMPIFSSSVAPSPDGAGRSRAIVQGFPPSKGARSSLQEGTTNSLSSFSEFTGRCLVRGERSTTRASKSLSNSAIYQ